MPRRGQHANRIPPDKPAKVKREKEPFEKNFWIKVGIGLVAVGIISFVLTLIILY